MKPLLIVPPAPARWNSMGNLYAEALPDAWRADMEERFARGVGGQDAFAAIVDGGHVLSAAWFTKSGAHGFLGHILTRSDHRRQGLACGVVTTLLAWFDMVGGKCAHTSCADSGAQSLLASAGFSVLHASELNTVLVRGAATSRLADTADAAPRIRELSRADWPQMFALLQRAPGPDPRVSLRESALSAEATLLEWLAQRSRGVTAMLGAFHDDELSGIATCAIDQLGQRTYAMTLPHGIWTDVAPLRAAVVDFAKTRGYEQVDFPMDALAPAGAGV
ncbi:MAG: hypothetical protein U1D55_12430 [Phycisphaerae bacterium]